MVGTRTVGGVKLVEEEVGAVNVPPQSEVHCHEPAELGAESVTG